MLCHNAYRYCSGLLLCNVIRLSKEKQINYSHVRISPRDDRFTKQGLIWLDGDIEKADFEKIDGAVE